MVQAIVFLPLAGFLIAGLFGRAIGARGASLITSGLLLATALLSWIVFFEAGFYGNESRIRLMTWIAAGGL
jgi:NADH-quinone oxidoreductase subunit L